MSTPFSGLPPEQKRIMAEKILGNRLKKKDLRSKPGWKNVITELIVWQGEDTVHLSDFPTPLGDALEALGYILDSSKQKKFSSPEEARAHYEKLLKNNYALVMGEWRKHNLSVLRDNLHVPPEKADISGIARAWGEAMAICKRFDRNSSALSKYSHLEGRVNRIRKYAQW
ncbi:hypothetical protein OTB20_38635 [Streptomyces sp. H27-H1]|uniref:hypothetical protein n=1 Tax=Streptomyces sp. H27-H1 TaxID=2996461 RepID=UPI002270CF60|nr:hypothetical protein [Streptomyces sp. H27-H1]MCY0931994.1 hypothetical protein [Streptomyces sp. H27-H1]